jgi:hypothetical protein
MSCASGLLAGGLLLASTSGVLVEEPLAISDAFGVNLVEEPLAISDAFGVNLSHSHDTQFICRPSLGVLGVSDRPSLVVLGVSDRHRM